MRVTNEPNSHLGFRLRGLITQPEAVPPEGKSAMPAAVVPTVHIEIGMQVEHDGRYLVGCPDCDWYPDPFFDEGVAKQDAYQHNVEHHDGAGVQVQLATPVTLAEKEVAHQRKLERLAMWTAIGYALFALAMGAMLGMSWLLLLNVAIWCPFIIINGHSWGVWTERRLRSQYELEQMREAFKRAMPDEGTQQ